jgi:hypothetical protein
VLVSLRKEPAGQDIPVAFLMEQDAVESVHFLTTGVAAVISTLNGVDAVVAEVRQLLMPVIKCQVFWVLPSF